MPEVETKYTLKDNVTDDNVTDDMTDDMRVQMMRTLMDYNPSTPIGFFSKDYDKDNFDRFCKTLDNEKQQKQHTDTKQCQFLSLLYNIMFKKKQDKQLNDIELYQFLSKHLDRIDEVAHDVGILDNNIQLLAHRLYHNVIKFQTKLEGLLYPEYEPFMKGNLLLTGDVGLDIFMITGLDQDIDFGGMKTYVTTSELVPVCRRATCYTSLYTRASDKLITCYSIGYNIIKLFDKDHIFRVGRFRFGQGICRISTNDNDRDNGLLK